MKRRRHTPEQAVRKLREGERMLGDGKDLAEVLRHLEITESTWHRWRQTYGGTIVWRLRCMSQEFDEGPVLRQDPGDQLALAYDFESESGDYAWEEIIFTGVVRFSFTTARYCSEAQIGATTRW